MLVSIVVISYNSENTIIETLDSIKRQTYNNIELIVSDDCSQDHTIKVVSKWLDNNKNRFARTELLTVDHNTGIPANANRGMSTCKGEWIKFIAGDDVLFQDCIESCVNFVLNDLKISWLVGKIKKYQNIINDTKLIEYSSYYNTRKIDILNANVEAQKEAIVKFNFIDAPAVFISAKIIKSLGGFDEQYMLLEDWPMWKKLIFDGNKCYFMDKYIVGYRSNDKSIYNSTTRLFNINCKKCVFLFIKKELFQYNSFCFRINKKLHYLECVIFQRLGLNKNNFFCRKLYAFFYILIDIVFVIF